MARQIILLTGETEFPLLSKGLLGANTGLELLHANSRSELTHAMERCDLASRSVRLLCFSSNVIVPSAVLNALPGPAYNFHPGPPEYPGSNPDSFAIYEGAARFGATVHEMAAKVDAGPIVKVSEFDIPEDANSLDLAALAYQRIASLFFDLAPYFATVDDPLPRIDRKWGPRKTTRADHARMKALDETAMSDAERARWRRAFG